MPENEEELLPDQSTKCEVSSLSLPDKFAERYSSFRDPATEKDIAQYVEIEARDENVKHVELIKTEYVLGEKYEIWDVVTDKDRWWVVTNMTNLYSQAHFPSLDYTLSFHIGLMMRIQSRPAGPESDDPTPFDEVFRRQEQAKSRFDRAVEPEDYQAVGMQLRECLLSLSAALRRRVEFPPELERPQDANFINWSDVLINFLCGGSSNENLRRYLKGIGKDTWQLVNWLTHYRGADKTACSIAVHGCDTVVGHFIQIFERAKAANTTVCPVCSSRNIRTHYAPEIGDDGDYFTTCGVCDWTTYPESNQSLSRRE